MNLPPDFDQVMYRSLHADLGGMSEADLHQHWTIHGEIEGRVAAPTFTRQDLRVICPPDSTVLEIGPFSSPLFRGPSVSYFDVLDREALRQRAREHAYGDPDAVPHIDFVSPTGDLSIVVEQFDYVASCHCIEHQPDLIEHLTQVERILGQGGAYLLVVPDKRYCFDHFIAAKTIADVIEARGRRRHSIRSVIEGRSLVTHNFSEKHWAGEHSVSAVTQQGAAPVSKAIKEYEDAGDTYIDVHAWQFTPHSFREIMGLLYELGMTRLHAARVYATPWGRNEFCAVLTRA